jgi:type I restriction enzyme, S subunit
MTDNNGLPQGWVLATVGELYKVLSGGTPSTKIEEYWDGDIPWITSANIHGLKDIRPERTVTKTGIKNSSTNLVPKGSIIVVTRVSLGKVALAETDLCFSQDSQALLPTDKVHHGYALYYLSWAAREFQSKSRGTTISGITKKQLLTLEFPLAALSEQERIVAKIEELFTQLEVGVAELGQAKAQLQRYRQAVLKSAVEGELTREWRLARRIASDSPEPAAKQLARILSERRAKWEAEELAKLRAKGKEPKNDKWKAKYKEPVPPDTNELLELPEGWVWASVEQISAHEPNSITDGPFGSKLKTVHYKDAGPRVIRLQNIGDGVFYDEKAHISDDHFETLRKHEIFAGDLVIGALGATLPRSCIIPEFVGPAIVKADCMRFKPHVEIGDVRYMNATLNSQVLKNNAASIIHGIGRPRLNQGEIKSLQIPLPTLEEQKVIANKVERRLSVADEIEKELDQALARSERLRQSILKKAFEGRL